MYKRQNVDKIKAKHAAQEARGETAPTATAAQAAQIAADLEQREEAAAPATPQVSDADQLKAAEERLERARQGVINERMQPRSGAQMSESQIKAQEE